jgi:Ca2+-binding RTX toxin-like protein
LCVLCISNPFVDWHKLDSTTTEPAQASTGAGGSSNGTSVSFNPDLVDQLDSGSYWYNSDGSVAQTISYGFTTSNTFASGFGEASGWSAFTTAQKTAVRQMMTLWDDLIAPSLVESTGSPNTADIKFSNSTTDVSFAHAYFPGQVNSETNSWDKIDGSVWLNPTYNSGVNNLVTPISGVYGYMAILHEIGHSLGLDHGGNYNGGSPQYGNTSTGWLYAEDSYQYTIMSYFNASATGASWGSKYAQTPMVYDIMAIQQIYGADYTTRSGDTIYGFNSTAGNSLYDFTQNTSPILTIWDGNGIDTIDLSGWSSASTLNLTAGSYSSVNGMTKNLAIAYDVDIENATGGSGKDVITGNDLGNILIGNGGNDTINGAGGNDTINGGTGVDILIGGAGNDTIYFDASDNLTLLDGGVGFDTLIQLGVLITFDFAGHNFERLLNIITDLGSAAWSEQTDYYDVSGLYYEYDIAYDNGTRSVTEYDAYDTETWSEWTVTYAANGNIMSEVFVPDSGSGSAPSITSNGAGSAAAVNIVENTTAVTTVTASNPDAGAVLAYSIIGGADAAKFTINATTGVLGFVSAPNFEAPTDVGANNIYDVRVRVSNGALTDTQTIAVAVTDVDEPTILNGTSSNNVLNGAAGLNIIDGLAGNDTLAGLGGADTLIGGVGTDTATYVASAAGVNVSLMTELGSGGDAEGDTLSTIENLTGSNLDDTLEGNGGNNVLAGGLGIDTVSYAHALAGVKVSLATTSSQNTIGAGSDKLTGFENVTGSNFNDTLTGTIGYNVLTGLAGNDTLNGGVGADTMFGGTGNDTYVVDNAGDIVDETGGDGTDTIQTALAFSLAALGSIENLTLAGSAAVAATGNNLNNVITGNAGANILNGLDGNDTLNGGAGADTMFGGTGNDTYVVDNIGDIVDETGGDGTDTVQSSINFNLSDAFHVKGEVENLTLTGTAATNGTGNTLANVITGNTGNNILAGLGGADTLIGGVGTDTATYVASLEGVNVSLMTGLGSGGDAEGDTLATIENLTGSNFDDTLEGNGGGNVLAGALGIDTVSYEHATAGVTVKLATTSSQNTGGAGSDKLTGFENVTGSNFNDTLTGTTGNNVLHGGAGNDILTGGSGSDTFDFSSLADGSDVITDFVTGTDHFDLIDLLDSAGLGSLDYATLIAQGNLVIQTGAFITGTSTNSATALDTRLYIDADGIGVGGSVVIATLEDTLTSAGDFLI